MEIPQIINETIDVLSTKLATPAEQLLSYASLGIRVEGAAELILLVGFSAIYVMFLKAFLKKNKNDKDWENEKTYVFAIGGLVVSGFAIAVISACEVSSVLVKIFAPEYWLLKEVMGL